VTISNDFSFQVKSDADHSRYRRLLAHAFSEKALREQEPLIKSYIDLLISKLHENAAKPQDMVAWYNFVSFDIIGDLTLGESFNCLQDAELHEWVSLLFKFFKGASHITNICRFPWLSNILIPLLISKSLVQTRNQHWAYTRDKVLKRIETVTDRPDFMSYVLRHNEKEVNVSFAISNINIDKH
jgi:cytochrome P450